MVGVINIEPIRERFSAVAPFLDERGRRLVAAAEAFAAGYGGIAAVAMATGIAPSTIGRGLKELASDEPSPRIRRPGAGRRTTISKDPTLLQDLQTLVEPPAFAGAGLTRGDPEIAVAADLQERAPSGAGAPGAGARDQPHPGRSIAQ